MNKVFVEDGAVCSVSEVQTGEEGKAEETQIAQVR